jgi:hypothetical protein
MECDFAMYKILESSNLNGNRYPRTSYLNGI